MYYQSSAKPNDPSEPEVDRLKTLLDNLNHLRGKLKNFTVIDELGQPIGEISDLILDSGHQLNLVISQPDDPMRHPSVLLNGRRIKKVSVQTQSVFVDITKADVRFLPEYLLPDAAPAEVTSTPAASIPSAMTTTPAPTDEPEITPPSESFATPEPVEDVVAPELQPLELVDWNQEESVDAFAEADQNEMDFLGEPLLPEDSLAGLPELELPDQAGSPDGLSFSDLLDSSTTDSTDLNLATDSLEFGEESEESFTLESIDELPSLDSSSDDLSEGALVLDATEELSDFAPISDFMASSEESFDFGSDANTDAGEELALPNADFSEGLESDLASLNLGESEELDFSGNLESDLPAFNLDESDTSLELGSLADLSTETESGNLLGDLPEMSLSGQSSEAEWAEFDRTVGSESTELEGSFDLGSLEEPSNVSSFEESSTLPGFETFDESEDTLADLGLDTPPLPDLGFGDDASNELGNLSGLELTQDASADDWSGFDELVGENGTTDSTFELGGLEEPSIDVTPASEEFSLSGLGTFEEPSAFGLGDLESPSVDEAPVSEEFSLSGLDSFEEPAAFDLGGLEDSSVDATPASEEFSLSGLDSLEESTDGLTEEFTLAEMESLDESDSLVDLGLEASSSLPELDSLEESEGTFDAMPGFGTEESLAEADEWAGFNAVVGDESSQSDNLNLDSSFDELTFQDAVPSSEEQVLSEEQSFGETFDDFSSLELPQDAATTSPGLDFVETNDDLGGTSDLGSIAVTPEDDFTGLDLSLGDPDGENLSLIESPDFGQDDLLGEPDLGAIDLSSGLEETSSQDDWALVGLSDEPDMNESVSEGTFDLGVDDSLSYLSELGLTDDFAAEESTPEVSLPEDSGNLDFSLETNSLFDTQDALGDPSTLDASPSDEFTESGVIDFDLSGLGEVVSSESETLDDAEPDTIAFADESDEFLGGLELAEAEAPGPSDEVSFSLGDDLLGSGLNEEVDVSAQTIDDEDTIESLTDLSFAEEVQVETNSALSFEDTASSSLVDLPELQLPGLEAELAQMPPLVEETPDIGSDFDSTPEELPLAAFAPDSMEVAPVEALGDVNQSQASDVVEGGGATISTSDPVDTIVPLLEERLKVEYERRKIGEVVVRKRIMTRMVQVPVRYETLVIEQVGSESAPLAEVDLSQGAIDNIDLSGVTGKPIVSGEFKSPKTASYVLDAIAKTLQHRCKKVRIEIELEDEKLQKAYQDWLNQCSQM